MKLKLEKFIDSLSNI